MSSIQISQYSLYNLDNYKMIMVNPIADILNKYNLLIIEYIGYIKEKGKFSDFIISRGIDTISNVFAMMLYYSQNLDMSYYHSQKAFYFYVEFVGQIMDDSNLLQLSSRDAVMFVYKKTIFEINVNIQKNVNTLKRDELDNIKIDIINSHIRIVKLIVGSFTNACTFMECLNHINKFHFDKEDYEIILEFVHKIIKLTNATTIVEFLGTFTKQIALNHGQYNKELLKQNISNINSFSSSDESLCVNSIKMLFSKC